MLLTKATALALTVEPAAPQCPLLLLKAGLVDIVEQLKKSDAVQIVTNIFAEKEVTITTEDQESAIAITGQMLEPACDKTLKFVKAKGDVSDYPTGKVIQYSNVHNQPDARK